MELFSRPWCGVRRRFTGFAGDARCAMSRLEQRAIVLAQNFESEPSRTFPA